jgi:hypothetical protein
MNDFILKVTAIIALSQFVLAGLAVLYGWYRDQTRLKVQKVCTAYINGELIDIDRDFKVAGVRITNLSLFPVQIMAIGVRKLPSNDLQQLDRLSNRFTFSKSALVKFPLEIRSYRATVLWLNGSNFNKWDSKKCELIVKTGTSELFYSGGSFWNRKRQKLKFVVISLIKPLLALVVR